MIEAKNLRKAFGTNVVLKDISLSIGRGKVVALIGPSGSGKSTLLRCLNLLTLPDKGFVRAGGRAIAFDEGLPLPDDRTLASFRAKTGMVFQHFNLFPHMTVVGNVMEGLVSVLRKPQEEARQSAIAVLENVGLAEKANMRPAQLSGGQKQRVAIARALVMRPEIMLFDEATSALDPELVAEVLNVVGGLARDGMTMILATHEMDFAREVADTVIFMRDGVILEHGPAREVIDRPQSHSAQQFLSHFHRIGMAR